MLEDGQPGRATVYVGAIRQRGGRAPLGLQDVARGVEEALDQTDPQRARAAEIERSIGDNLARFRQTRLAALRDGGIGVTSRGEAGTGASGQVASASVAAKMAAFIGSGAAEAAADKQ